MPESRTPAELGYSMPAEWAPHEATWLAWPHNKETWPGKFEPIPSVWADLVRILSQYETVNILAAAGPVMDQAREMVGGLPRVRLHDIATNDVWIRDHGPTFLVGPQPAALVDWKYNAWGEKYPPFDKDDRVPERIAELTGYRRFAAEMVMEGGAIDVNGQGTLLTTEQCLLHPNRNPGLSREEIERRLKDFLGVRQAIWLAGGIVGDDTDGHIDELARFVAPRTVLAVVEPDPSDENHFPLAENLARLRRSKDQDGRDLEVVTLCMPRPVYFGEHRLPASYANFYVADGAVIVPQFDDPADQDALDTLARLFPGRKIHGLSAIDLAWGLGAFHCITQQQPRQ